MGAVSVALLSATTGLAGATANGDPGEHGPIASHECAQATEPCDGDLLVPLNWADPHGEQIEVGFHWIPRADQEVPADGTVFFHGGGSGQAIAAAESYAAVLGPVLEHKNLLLMDARGWGESSPLFCEDIDMTRPETVAPCAEVLGERQQWFTSDQTVQDLDAVRAALGVDRMLLFGNSYGTVFAQGYAARFAGHVEAVLLDSPMVIQDDGYVHSHFHHDFYVAAREVLGELCAESAACRVMGREPVELLDTVVTSLRTEPDPIVTPAALFNLVTTWLFDAAVGTEITAALSSLDAGDPAPLRRIVAAGAAMQTPPDPEQAAVLTMLCGTGATPWDRLADAEVRAEQLDEFYRKTGVLEPFTSAEIQPNSAQRCVDWPTHREAPVVPPGIAFPAMPVLVMVGRLDTATPVANARAVAARFPDAELVEVPFGNHADSLGGASPHTTCTRELGREFLLDPQRPVGAHDCDGRAYVPYGSFPRAAADLPGVRGGPEEHRDRVTAGVATAADAALRLHPASRMAPFAPELPGLRGGKLAYDFVERTVELADVRFVHDVAVDGEIIVDSEHRARATLVVTDHHGGYELDLAWSLLGRTADQRVDAVVDGVPFTLAVPRF